MLLAGVRFQVRIWGCVMSFVTFILPLLFVVNMGVVALIWRTSKQFVRGSDVGPTATPVTLFTPSTPSTPTVPAVYQISAPEIAVPQNVPLTQVRSSSHVTPQVQSRVPVVVLPSSLSAIVGDKSITREANSQRVSSPPSVMRMQTLYPEDEVVNAAVEAGNSSREYLVQGNEK